MKVVIAGIILASIARHQSYANCPGETYNDKCYFFLSGSSEWEEAKQLCEDVNGRLPVITNRGQGDFLSEMLRRFRENYVWISARKMTRQWFWVANGLDLSSQGCYADSAASPDLEYVIQIDGMTVELCKEECMREHYDYAGLQNGDQCLCGNDFGRYGQITRDNSGFCSVRCDGDPDQRCGGNGVNDIHRVNGAYGEWAFNQPNNWSGHQYCGALLSINDQYKLGDENCYELIFYLCDIPCPEDNSTECMFVSDSEASWFDARADCMTRGGDLMYIQDDAHHMEVGDFLFDSDHSLHKHWVGLATFEWSDADDNPLVFTDFSDRSPRGEDADCIAFSRRHDYKWKDVACSEDSSILCEQVIATTPTPSLSSTTTPQPHTPVPQTPAPQTPTPRSTTLPTLTPTKRITQSLSASPSFLTGTPKSTLTPSSRVTHSSSAKTTLVSMVTQSTLDSTTTTNNSSSSKLTTTLKSMKPDDGMVRGEEKSSGIRSSFRDLSLFDILLLVVLLALALAIFSCAIVFAVYKRNHRTNQITDSNPGSVSEVSNSPTDLAAIKSTRSDQQGSKRRLTFYADGDASTC